MDQNQRFPFLSNEERELVFSFEQGKVPQNSIVELMLRLSDQFRAADTSSQRISARAKLLGLAGLYEIIPVEKFENAKNAPLSLTLLELQIEENEEPLRALMRCGEVPFDMIANFPNLKEFFGVSRPDGTTYLQNLLKKQSELGGVLVVFKPSINEEVVGYVSASSEPLTRSIIVNPWVEAADQELRDFASMAYDLVMQMEFLDIFYRCKSTLDRVAIQGAMRLEGLAFVLDVFSVLLDRAIAAKHLEIEITPAEVLLKNKAGKEGAELCRYLKYLLYSLAKNTIMQLEKILGLQISELEVGKVLLEHPINFDPRRIEMKIVN